MHTIALFCGAFVPIELNEHVALADFRLFSKRSSQRTCQASGGTGRDRTGTGRTCRRSSKRMHCSPSALDFSAAIERDIARLDSRRLGQSRRPPWRLEH